MPNPKRRHSKARRDKRRTHYKAAVPTLIECPQCHEQKLAHHACPNCGYYKGRVVITPKE